MQRIRTWGLLFSCLSGAALAQPMSSNDQQQWLLEQVRIGEASYREDLVRDSLARLELIAPNDPEVLLAKVRQALQQKNPALAEARVAQLRSQAPGSPQLQHAEDLLMLQTPEGQKRLQEARLLAAAGRAEESAKLYEQLFDKGPPDFITTMEFWSVRSNIPAQRDMAIEHLYELDQQYPGNVELQKLMGRLLTAQKRDAEREYKALLDMPMGSESAQAWQGFIEHYRHLPIKEDARNQLQRQQQLLGDPAWRAGITGKKLVDEGKNANAEADLRRALIKYPEDPSLHGALGIALMRQKKYEGAYDAFSSALSKEQDSRWISKWADLKTANYQWMLLQKGDAALERKEYSAAQGFYQRAHDAKPGDADALVGLAAVARAQQRDTQAETLLLKARKLEPGNGSVVRALVRLYQSQSPGKAEAFLDSLSPSEQREFAALRDSLALDRLKEQADAAAQRADWAQVAASLSKARVLAPDDPWLTYRLANSQRELGQRAAADDSFRQLLQRKGQDSETRYAHALYLASDSRDAEAQDSLSKIPVSAWTDNMHELANRLRRRQLQAQVSALRERGQEDQAEALLLRSATVDDYATLADWSLQRGEYAKAQRYYRTVLEKEPQNADAQLGMIETLIASGQKASARQALQSLKPSQDVSHDPAYQRRLANAWAAVGERDKANAVFAQLMKTPQTDPVIYRDAARSIAKDNPQQALDYYARGMAAAGMLTPEQAVPRDDRALTLASREQDGDDWLASSLRSDVDKLYQQTSPTITLYHDYLWRTDNSASGISDLVTQTSIVRVDTPLLEGHGFLQAENIDLNADSFKTNADGRTTTDFGTCSVQLRRQSTGAVLPKGCVNESQSVSGPAMALGWNNAQWSFDLGRTPDTFEIPNWLGGVSYGSDWHTLGWRLTASRRPVSNSVVSYSGAVDPNTGIRWGGVTSNGLTLSLSHDQGGVDGIWASLGSYWLRGKNVENNQKRSAMAGYYYRLIDRADERLRTGLTLMYWGYDNNQDEYTLGNGGYYSPQKYYSVSVPLNYNWRNSDWSVRLESSVGWSHANTDAISSSKLQSLIRNAGYEVLDGGSLTSSSGSSSGASIRLQGLFERRLTDHMVLGSGITWQHSDAYAPSTVVLYLRYSFDVWQGNLPLPIEPVTPYADFL